MDRASLPCSSAPAPPRAAPRLVAPLPYAPLASVVATARSSWGAAPTAAPLSRKSCVRALQPVPLRAASPPRPALPASFAATAPPSSSAAPISAASLRWRRAPLPSSAMLPRAAATAVCRARVAAWIPLPSRSVTPRVRQRPPPGVACSRPAPEAPVAFWAACRCSDGGLSPVPTRRGSPDDLWHDARPLVTFLPGKAAASPDVSSCFPGSSSRGEGVSISFPGSKSEGG
jgi:hypothetical protein